MREIRVQSLGREYLLEKEIATHSSILAWKIPWTEDPGRLPSVGYQRVGHDWVTSLPSLQWTFIDHRQCRRCCRDTELRIQEASLLQTLEHWDSHVQWMLRYNENRRPDATQGSPGFPEKLKKLPAPIDNFLSSCFSGWPRCIRTRHKSCWSPYQLWKMLFLSGLYKVI